MILGDFFGEPALEVQLWIRPHHLKLWPSSLQHALKTSFSHPKRAHPLHPTHGAARLCCSCPDLPHGANCKNATKSIARVPVGRDSPELAPSKGFFFIPVSLRGWNQNQVPSHAALLHDFEAQKGINACQYCIRENLCNKNGESGCPLDGKGYQNIRVWRTGAVPASLPNTEHKSNPLQERAITNFFLQQQ